MGVMRVYILTGLIGIKLVAGPSSGQAQEDVESPPVGRDRFLLVPMRNPLADYDANTMAWHSATELFHAGGDALFGGLGWQKSIVGRTVHLAYTAYTCLATNHYSHEMAHETLNKTARHFRIDLSDWSQWFPSFIPNPIPDEWDMEEFEYYRLHPFDTHIYEWFLKSVESGFYQQTLNGRFIARLSNLSGSTAFTDGVTFYINQWYQFEYIRKYGDDPIRVIETEYEHYGILGHNDVTAYIRYMSILGTEISKETWLAAAGLSALLSNQMWNSVLSAYGYIVHGEQAVRNIEFGSEDGIRVATPNFYLYPTLYGLYLESETSIRGIGGGAGTAFVTLGAGLDSFGIERTGNVGTVRLGALYSALQMPLPVDVSPYIYLDFDRDMKHRGHSVGVAVETSPLWRFFFTARFEHNRSDMIEQIIKSRDDGFYAIAGLGFRI